MPRGEKLTPEERIIRKMKYKKWLKFSEEGKELERKWYRKCHLKRKHGLSVEDYEKLLKQQQGRCAICFELPNRIALAVDHNHKTGKIRGLLCNNCNRALGHAKDSKYLLQEMVYYLDKYV